jgi:hemerythrin-like domain-containing protein
MKGEFMMNIDSLRNQHIMIRKIVSEIESIIHAGDIVSQAFELSLKIGQLSGSLVLHLKSEDDFLYPSLKHSASDKVRITAEEFNKEMGSLAQTFTDYKRTYMLATNIKNNTQKFLTETQLIISALKNRLDKEDRILYPLLST